METIKGPSVVVENCLFYHGACFNVATMSKMSVE